MKDQKDQFKIIFGGEKHWKLNGKKKKFRKAELNQYIYTHLLYIHNYFMITIYK